MGQPEAGHRGCLVVVRLEARHDPIALAPLLGDARKERLERVEPAQLGHRVEGEVGVVVRQLSDHAAMLPHP